MWEKFVENAPGWILIVAATSLVITVFGIFLRLRKRWMLAKEDDRRRREDLYTTAIKEFEHERRWISEAASGVSAASRLPEPWYSMTPYEHVRREATNLNEYWEPKGRRYRAHSCEARRLIEAVDSRLDIDAVQDTKTFEAAAGKVLTLLDRLTDMVKRDQAA